MEFGCCTNGGFVDFKIKLIDIINFFSIEIVITVSTGGNILVNVGPTQNGLIQPIFVERLRQMGSWLKVNGDAIYKSNPWIYQNDTKTPNVWYTSHSEQTDRTIVYAIILQYPYDSAGINLYSLGGKFDNNTKARMLGYPKNLKVILICGFYKTYFFLLNCTNFVSLFSVVWFR